MASKPLYMVYGGVGARWSGAEKTVARKAFQQALGRELDEVIREAKKRAATIKEPADVWELEAYLTQRRKDIDRRYDYRYSQLPIVFGVLLREGRVQESQLHGLSEDKLDCIRTTAGLGRRTKPDPFPGSPKHP